MEVRVCAVAQQCLDNLPQGKNRCEDMARRDIQEPFPYEAHLCVPMFHCKLEGTGSCPGIRDVHRCVTLQEELSRVQVPISSSFYKCNSACTSPSLLHLNSKKFAGAYQQVSNNSIG